MAALDPQASDSAADLAGADDADLCRRALGSELTRPGKRAECKHAGEAEHASAVEVHGIAIMHRGTPGQCGSRASLQPNAAKASHGYVRLNLHKRMKSLSGELYAIENFCPLA